MLGHIRIAVRMLAKTPAFTAVAVLALALGIGISTTVFSVVNALLVRPWPHMTDQDRVLYFAQYFSKQPDHDKGVAYPDYLDFRQQAKTLEGIGACQDATFILTGSNKPERYLGSFITADAFSFLGVKPMLGRLFRPEEDQPNAQPVALLGYDVWTNHFGADRNVLGKVVTLNGKRATIIGVMNTLIQDLRYGVRLLLKNKAFAFIAILAIALGIGANTAIFSLVNGVLLRALAFPHGDFVLDCGPA